MKYHLNPAGNRIIDATPDEIHALRPAICAAYRRWRCPDGNIEDFAQDTEIVVWQAVIEGRVWCDRLTSPEDALTSFMFATAWNLWRNHTRKRSTWSEVLHDEMPDMVGSSPDGRFAARETLTRIAMHEDIARVLLDVLNVPFAERAQGLPRTTYCTRLTNARRWARDVDAGHWRGPLMPEPSTPWHRKKKR